MAIQTNHIASCAIKLLPLRICTRAQHITNADSRKISRGQILFCRLQKQGINQSTLRRCQTFRSDQSSFYEGKCWSGREDLNLRLHGPEPCALPGCATPRRSLNNIGAAGLKSSIPYKINAFSGIRAAYGGNTVPSIGNADN
jgi:hypothetical protein